MPKVLVVEDSPTQAEELRLVLESAGFEVGAATSGEAALDVLLSDSFDIIVSDIVMPGITGYDLCRRVKADRARREIPIVLLTTLSDPMDIIQGLECGADNFLTKPYDPEILVARIQTLLENRKMRSDAKLKVGVEILFLGKRFTVTSDKEQILDLLVSTFEDIVRTNRQLQEKQDELARAKAQIEEYARRVEGQARVTSEKYAQLMDRANDMIFVLDERGIIQEANRRCEELLLRPRAQILGMRCSDLVPLKDRAAAAESLRALVQCHSGYVMESHIERPAHPPIPVEISASMIELAGEKVILLIARDITERRKNEQALRAAEAQLRQAQKMEAIGRLAGGIAHDFNNLLTAIQGYGDLLLRKLRPQERHDAEEIKKAAQRAAGLTRQLLAFSRSQVLQPVVLDLNEVMIDLEKMLRRLIGENYQLASKLGTDLGRVKVDRGQVEQVVMNLVVNARDAMPGGGRILIETQDVELDDSFRQRDPAVRPGPYVMFAVSDTGCGMSPEVLARAFEPFFTTKEPGKGTGLGLSTVYGIVKQSGGHVWVYSEVGKGSTFKVYLPRVDELPATARAETKSETTGSETILLAEDDDLVRNVTRRMLELGGYTVLTARNGNEALEAIQRDGGKVALLVSDVVMPGLGAKELARGALALAPGLRILFLSGYSGGAVEANGELAQNYPFLQKPFTPDALARKVREVLDAR